MKNIVLIAAALLITACGSKPVQPDWKSNAATSLRLYSQAYLKGEPGNAATEFARARSEMASTGRPDLVAHSELYRCATRLAALEMEECTGFTALAQDATLEERAYAAYLGGRWEGLNVALLPGQHRAIVQAKAPLSSITDPLSQLVAAGVLLKTTRITPQDIATATATASAQGWRRPLLVWLGVAHKRAMDAGDTLEAARLQRRIDLAAGTK